MCDLLDEMPNSNETSVNKVLYLLGARKRKLSWMLLLFLTASLFDVLGIGLIVPYVELIVRPDDFIQSELGGIFTDLFGILSTEDLLIVFGVVLVSVFVIKMIFGLLINYIILNFCFSLAVDLKSNLMQTYQQMSYIEYIKRNSSEYIYNINLASVFSQSILLSIMRVISESVVAISIILLLFLYNGIALFMLVALIGGVTIAYDQLFKKRIEANGTIINKSSTLMIQALKEAIDGLKEVRILGKENFFHNTVVETSKQYSQASVSTQIFTSAPRYLLELVLILFIVLLVISTLLLGQDIQALLPTLTIFGVASIRLIPSANQIISNITRLRFQKDALNIFYDDYKEKQSSVKQKHLSSNIDTSDFSKFESLVLNKVGFTYPGAAVPALTKVDLKISSGDSIGIIGTSGSGKSTLVDILLGFLTPQEGAILYNGQGLDKVINSWRSQVAYLPQEIFLIDASLKDNIALDTNSERENDENINNSLRQAQLSELIDQLPQGVKTIIGENGIRLSGGQRQRIALARAFYHDKNILVMDESTSALDTDTEREIVDEIKLLKGDKTMIVIAHRITTLQHCDHIYQFEKGEIVWSGSYSDLLEKS